MDGTTTPGHSAPGINSNNGVHHIHLSSRTGVAASNSV